MPRDDGEFYQFCYVTSKGLVRGASTPFQFRQPGMDDYVEVEDIEDDIMVVKTRADALEDDLKIVLLAKEKLIEVSSVQFESFGLAEGITRCPPLALRSQKRLKTYFSDFAKVFHRIHKLF